MTAKPNSTETGRSLGPTKAEPFGVVLRAAIRDEFGSNKAFAQSLGVSEGRVSQIVNGPEAPDAATLERVLCEFNTLALQERIHEAWVRDFAPLPDLREQRFEAEQALSQVNRLEDEAMPLRALQLARMCRRNLENDPIGWQLLSERIIHLNLRLTQVSPALTVVDEMRRRAIARSDQTDLLTALWMRGQSLRNLESVTVMDLSIVHDEAVSYCEAIKPPPGPAREKWQHRGASLRRDFALHLLRVQDRQPVGTNALQTAIASVERSMEDGDLHLRGAGLEVRARVECALGQLTKAEETLDELRELGLQYGPDLVEKLGVTRARILVKRGQRDSAVALYKEVARTSFEKMNLHKHREADQELARLLAGL